MNSKNLIWYALTICCITLISCGSDDEDPTGPVVDPMEEDNFYPTEYFCDDLFTAGDYSGICEIETATPDQINVAPGLSGESCVYFINVNDDEGLFLSINFHNSVESARTLFQGISLPFAVGNVDGSVNDLVTDNISDVGDGTKLLRYRDDDGNNQKFMVTWKSNAIFYLITGHEAGTLQPCISGKDEMARFMKEVVENL